MSVPELLRWLLPLCALLLFLSLGHGLLLRRNKPEIWAWLVLPDGRRLPVTHWENTLGSAASCDLRLTADGISRVHCVLCRCDDGSWTVTDADSKTGIRIGNRRVKTGTLKYGQSVALGKVRVTLEPVTAQQEAVRARYRLRTGKVRAGGSLLLLSLFQILLAAFSLDSGADPVFLVLAQGAVFCLQWLLFLFYRAFRRRGFEQETVAFFLSSLSLAVVASAAPGELMRQTLCILLGVALFLCVGWCLRDLRRAQVIRRIAAVCGLLLLIITLVFGTEVNGAKNWIYLGGLSVQPSELAKICFVFVAASPLDRLVTRRNLLLFLLYTGAVCCLLALLSDFGGALVFFVAFLAAAFLRSGNFAALGFITAGTGIAGGLALRFVPHVSRRFAAWGKVWDYAQTLGYQQTRSMMCIASGGILGLGAGQGWLRRVAASDTDLVFALVSEEWGLALAVLAVLILLLPTIFTVFSAGRCRSSFHAIGGCTAAVILLTQTILNVFGTLDLLPLTGVTFPFLSNGGTGMIAAWGLLAFLKAADTRQNASFTIRLPEKEAP